jgi:hypothetical protein
VLSVDSAFEKYYPKPDGELIDRWPPAQTEYLKVYVKEIGCNTALVERHYIDRVFMQDEAVFYVRSLRSYPNFTSRIHFFAHEFDESAWRAMLKRAAAGQFAEIEKQLQTHYRGFTIVRPLPARPVGRTVLPAVATRLPENTTTDFRIARPHAIHLAGFTLRIEGVPFQQQDSGVSACATTALWSALDGVASHEELPASSPASIAEAATRYPVHEGRPFPTDGLSVRQICEATRAAGFSPLVVRCEKFVEYEQQIYSYATSGFAPVLAIESTTDTKPNHAVCTVGLRLGAVKPRIDPSVQFREASTALAGLYIHDDRLGPYAFAELSQFTDTKGKIRTRVAIEWPDKIPDQDWLLHAIVVPVPQKLRLTLTSIRRVALVVAESIGRAAAEAGADFACPDLTLRCGYDLARRYGAKSFGFGLTDEGLYRLLCQTPLSRYVGIIELTSSHGPVLDIVLDTTEVDSEMALLACIKRSAWPRNQDAALNVIARHLGIPTIS